MTNSDTAPPDDGGKSRHLLAMYWQGRHSTEPRLVDIHVLDALQRAVGAHEKTEPDDGAAAGRHADTSTEEVGLEVETDLIFETVQPAPDGTPVVFAQALKIVQMFGKWWRCDT